MTATLSPSQHDSIRRLLQATSTPKSEIARRFHCSRQTILRIDKELKASRSPASPRSQQEIEAKRELDSAFNAFERCNSRDNYRRLDEARYAYETVCGRLANDPHRAHLVDA